MTLSLEKIEAEAVEQTDLKDFGRWNFRQPLGRLIEGLNNEANLSEMGQQIQHHRLVGILVTRLKLEDYCQRHPEILKEDIKEPVVIVGLPRTGTTLLQRLLAADPRFYSAAWWETRFPVPMENNPRETHKRISVAKAEVEGMLTAIPELATIHPMSATEADEEISLLEQSFFSTSPESAANLGEFGKWLAQQDQTEGYEYLKVLLQFLQWQKKQRGESRDRWVLKSPHHLHFMDVLFKVFPDARVVQTHRDPLQTIPSLCSFVHTLWKMSSENADPLAAGKQWSEKMATGLKNSMVVRKQLPADRFHDVQFQDTVADPLQVLEGIYQFIDMPLTEEAVAEIEKWRESNRRELRAPHKYSLEQFGLSERQLNSDFEDYRQKYVS